MSWGEFCSVYQSLTRVNKLCTGGGGNFAPSQIRGVKFRCGKFRGAPWLSVSPPARVYSVYRWCARNLRRTLNFAWEISRSI